MERVITGFKNRFRNGGGNYGVLRLSWRREMGIFVWDRTQPQDLGVHKGLTTRPQVKLSGTH